jgi:hypothetical protein
MHQQSHVADKIRQALGLLALISRLTGTLCVLDRSSPWNLLQFLYVELLADLAEKRRKPHIDKSASRLLRMGL